MKQFSCLDSKIHLGPIGEGELSKILTESFANSKKIILVDENTNVHCLPYLFLFADGLADAEIIELTAGEENKTMEMCFSVWEALTEMEASRHDLFICLGGGMICDMGGFIASIYKRGMNFIYLPTSLLAMVDASLGGKTGVDLGAFKNQLGTFSQASHVFIDTAFLSTLPQKEKLNGLAEMLKHGLIADENHFKVLSSLALEEITENQIFDSLQIKAKIVEQDPLEKGARKLLNFGHTIGHAIEGTLLHTSEQMDHGLAVAHGMLVEAKISFDLKLLSEEAFQEIERVLRSSFNLSNFDKEGIEDLMQVMRQDKKRSDNQNRFTLLSGIGSAEFNVLVSDEEVKSALCVLAS